MKHEDQVPWQREEEGISRKGCPWIMPNTGKCDCTLDLILPSFPPILVLVLTLVWGLSCLWMLDSSPSAGLLSGVSSSVRLRLITSWKGCEGEGRALEKLVPAQLYGQMQSLTKEECVPF